MYIAASTDLQLSWYLFFTDSMGLSSVTSTCTQLAPEKAIQGKVVHYSNARSFKVIKNGTNRKRYATSY